jgi:phenylalanyl-tRNA synthetase beta subunit
MKVLHSWLQDYIKEELPTAADLADRLTMHAFEVESVIEIDGDWIIDIDVLPNRAADALSHIGIAREIATLFNLTLTLPATELTPADFLSADLVELTVAPLVRRASKRVARQVVIGPSTDLIKTRLERLGQRSINNVVDITNYVMLETGQPVHAFDYDKLAGETSKSLAIRLALDGERITLLDGEEYKLDPSMLVIADSEKALDVAGIKGGQKSAIGSDTTRVLLSVCNFNPSNIRRTSHKLGLRTDASKRFENDLSPSVVQFAMARFSYLLAEHAHAELSSDVIDVYPRQAAPYKVGVSVKEINQLLGTSLSDKEVGQILHRLNFVYEEVKPIDRVLELALQLLDKPYKYGASISYDAPETFDCSSFTSYLFAQAGVAIPRVTIDQFVFGAPVEEKDLEAGDLVFGVNQSAETEEFERISDGAIVEQASIHYETKEYMRGTPVAAGVNHCGMYLGNGKVIHASGQWHKGKVVVEDMKGEEDFGFKQIVGFRRISDARERFVVTVPEYRRDIRRSADLVEEIGRVYGYEKITGVLPSSLGKSVLVNKEFYYGNIIRDILLNAGWSEVMTYAFTDQGEIAVRNPLARDKKFLRSSLQSGLEKSLDFNSKNRDLLGVAEVKLFELGHVFTKEREFLALGLAAEKKESVAQARELIAAGLGISFPEDDMNVWEIDLDTVLDGLAADIEYRAFTSGSVLSFQPFSSYPPVLRDIAVWVPEAVAKLELEQFIKEQAGNLLVQTRQFDEYHKDDRVSYAFRLAFQSPERTLSDAEVGEVMDRVTAAINKQEGWSVR